MANPIKVERFLGLTDLPAFNRDPGWLRFCGNMRVRPGGYLEMRGGLSRPRPAGVSGVAVDPASAANSGYFGAIGSSAPFGMVRWYGSTGAEFVGQTGNLALRSFISENGVAGSRLVIGADAPFSSVTLTLSNTAGGTFAFKYGTADGSPSTYANLTMSTSFDFASAVPAAGRQTTGSWAVPTNWVPTTEGNVTDGFAYKYFMVIERTGNGGALLLGHENLHSDWTGMSELYVSHGAPVSSAQNGFVKQYAHNVLNAAWNTVGSGLFSGNHPRYRFASYHGVLYFVNGIDQKRFDGSTLANVGLPRPTQTFTVADGGAGPGTWTGGLVATLQFRYAFTYGYGSQQIAVDRDLPDSAAQTVWGRTYTPTLFGESPPGALTTVAYPAGANRITIPDGNHVNISFATAPPADVDAIYVYRTDDLTNVPASAVDNMPYFFVGVILRSRTNIFLTVATTFYQDQRLDNPTPQKELDREDSTPPPRCKNIWIHKNRLFLANSDRYPGRVWWSKPFVLDSFDQVFDTDDFATTQGGLVMAGGDFDNESLVLTEDSLYGIADVDSDAPQSHLIVPIGCVAPDTFVIKDGVAMWLARDGVYRMRPRELPVKVSGAMDYTFNRMSREKHGWSYATIHNGQYELWLIKPNTVQPSDGYRYDITMEQFSPNGIGTWSTVGYSAPPLVVPMAAVTAPLGTEDAGVRHPFLAPLALGANGSFRVYLGEIGLLDDSAVIGVTADVHYGPSGFNYIKTDRVVFYYDADDGWGTPAISAPTTGELGYEYDTSDFGTPSPDTSWGNYRFIHSILKPRGSGTQDVVVRFTANSVGGGTLWGQRLMASYLTGEIVEPPRFAP